MHHGLVQMHLVGLLKACATTLGVCCYIVLLVSLIYFARSALAHLQGQGLTQVTRIVLCYGCRRHISLCSRPSNTIACLFGGMKQSVI